MPSDERRESLKKAFDSANDWLADPKNQYLITLPRNAYMAGFETATHHSASTITRLEQENQMLMKIIDRTKAHLDHRDECALMDMYGEGELWACNCGYKELRKDVEALSAPTTSDTKGESDGNDM